MEFLAALNFAALAGYLAIGVFVGFCAGLLGIGGGAIIVPLLALMFEAQGLPHEHVVHLAVGTAMGTILFTSVASVRAHARRDAVRWDLAKRITPGILAGGLAGSLLAGRFSNFGLALFFALFVYANATHMLLDFKPKPARATPGPAGMFAAGFAISAPVSAGSDRRRGALDSVSRLVQRADAASDRDRIGNRLSDRARG
jgi:uncharacterized membrane protein YfcA